MKPYAKLLHTLYSLGAVIFGNVLYALTVKLFLLPSGLVTGGTTGIALTVNHYLGIPITVFVFVFNVCMLAAGFFVLGKQFAMTTMASTFLYPLSLEFLNRLLGDFVLSDDLILCTVFTGIGIGISLGIVIRSGASTGGMDIPPLILRKFFHFPVSVTMYAFDVCILLSQVLFRPVENILYGILLIFIYTMVLDKMMLMGATRTEVKIVSQKSDKIRSAILQHLDRGVTLFDGEGGYLKDKTQIILSVISNRELPKLEKMVHRIDPECFMVISRVNEVSGRGFSMQKFYR